MNVQQLKAVCEAVQCRLNLTDAARRLHISHANVSRQIRELEEELGFDLFARSGKRLTHVTAPGREMLPMVERALREIENLQRTSREFSGGSAGKLVIATTHLQARYALPKSVIEFSRQFPQVELTLQQTFPDHIAELLISGRADIGIAAEALGRYPDLEVFAGDEWAHVAVVPANHPLANHGGDVTLAGLAEYPIITYDSVFTNRVHIDEAFARQGLAPTVALTALDADVIKAYVELGMGVGIVASIAIERERDRDLVALESTKALFPRNTTKIAMRKGAYLRDYIYHFLALFAPHLTNRFADRHLLEEAQAI